MTVRWFESNNDDSLAKWNEIENLDDKLMFNEDLIQSQLGFEEITKIRDHRGNLIQGSQIRKALSKGRECKMMEQEGLEMEMHDSDIRDKHWAGHQFECHDLSLVLDK